MELEKMRKHTSGGESGKWRACLEGNRGERKGIHQPDGGAQLRTVILVAFAFPVPFPLPISAIDIRHVPAMRKPARLALHEDILIETRAEFRTKEALLTIVEGIDIGHKPPAELMGIEEACELAEKEEGQRFVIVLGTTDSYHRLLSMTKHAQRRPYQHRCWFRDRGV